MSTLNLGIFLAYWIGYGFSTVTGSKSWRLPVSLQAVFIIPIIILTFLVPESPRWDIAHERSDRALTTIARLHARPTTDAVVLAQFQEITTAVQLEKSVGSGSWGQLFSLKDDELKSRKRLLIACFIQAAQQLGGINGIVSGRSRQSRRGISADGFLLQIYYAGNLLAATGLSAHGASLVSGFLFTVSTA